MYNIIKNNQEYEPFSLEDMKSGVIEIEPNTLVKKDNDLAKKAFEIPELREIITMRFESAAYEHTLGELLKYTCQFFKNRENGQPAALGTGVFIEIENDFYLVTAAHVWEEDNIFIWVGNNRFDINKATFPVFCMSPMKDGNRKNDKIDIAVVNITVENAEKLKLHFDFLPRNKVKINHIIDIDEKIPLYVVVGFAATKSKWNKINKVMKVSPFLFRTKLKINDLIFKKHGYKSKRNILLEWDKSKVIYKPFSEELETVQESPNPEGISGGGLWYICKRETHEEMKKDGYDFYLVGVMIEYNPNPKNENEKYVVATIIDYATESIRLGQGINVEKSKLVNIELKNEE